MGMNAFTEQRFYEYQQAIAKGYGVTVEKVMKTFSVTPNAQQVLRDKIVAESTFLPKINVIEVDQLTGEVIFGSVDQPVSSTTDTNLKERVARDVLGLTPATYELAQLDSDVGIKYSIMDAWSHLDNFFTLLTKYVQGRMARDNELIGWHGEIRAATSDPDTNPLLTDAGVGWMQILRNKRPANVFSEGDTPGEVRIGPGGDFENLDHAVADLVLGIPEHLRSGVVPMVGSELIGRDSVALYKDVSSDPTKKLSAAASLGMLGGYEWETPSNFPGRGLVITAHNNLSIYTQKGSWRKAVIDNPKRNRVEDFNSRNTAHVVEDTEAMVAVEFKNVKIWDGKAWI